MSTLTIGFGLFALSKGGLVLHGLELSECLTFGALISATDPVSTLAVFVELKVSARVAPTTRLVSFAECTNRHRHA